MTKILIAIGSNHHSRRNIVRARRLLTQALGTIVSSKQLVTPAIGITAAAFTNQLMAGETSLCEDELLAVLKEIETQCGDTKALRLNQCVNMDIDLLAYGARQHHTGDWHRGYIRELLSDMATNGGASSLDPQWQAWVKTAKEKSSQI